MTNHCSLAIVLKFSKTILFANIFPIIMPADLTSIYESIKRNFLIIFSIKTYHFKKLKNHSFFIKFICFCVH